MLDKLRLDGIELSYPSLCRYVAEFRRVEPGIAEPSTAPRAQEKPARLELLPRDPLANVRRLTQEKPPGFRYPGTMTEKELFGE